jgi:hypothetical protein
LSESVPLSTAFSVPSAGDCTVIVPAYISISTTLQPDGIELTVIEVILRLSNVVLPCIPASGTMILPEGTSNKLLSSLLQPMRVRLKTIIRDIE